MNSVISERIYEDIIRMKMAELALRHSLRIQTYPNLTNHSFQYILETLVSFCHPEIYLQKNL